MIICKKLTLDKIGLHTLLPAKLVTWSLINIFLFGFVGIISGKPIKDNYLSSTTGDRVESSKVRLELVAPKSADYKFKKKISREVLDNYLDRSITIQSLLTGRGNFDDNLRIIKNIGAKFIGRAVCQWGDEAGLLKNLEMEKEMIPKVHQIDPDIILQACIFEIITEQVDQVPVPDWAFTTLNMPVEKRNFRYADMLYPDGKFKNHWGRGSVPDVSQPETKKHARRGMIICDSHVPSGGFVREGKLLMDFHSFPLRIMEVPGKPEEAILKVGHTDALYNRSKGGITYSGWKCDHLPYLIEFDNFGVSRQPGQEKAGGIPFWVWGYDEISWFAHQNKKNRENWLHYAYNWLKETDPNGFLEMPYLHLLSTRKSHLQTTLPKGT